MTDKKQVGRYWLFARIKLADKRLLNPNLSDEFRKHVEAGYAEYYLTTLEVAEPVTKRTLKRIANEWKEIMRKSEAVKDLDFEVVVYPALPEFAVSD